MKKRRRISCHETLEIQRSLTKPRQTKVKNGGKIEVTRPLAFAAGISRNGMSWFLLLNAISASFIRRNYRVVASFVLTKGTIEENAPEPAYVACACT